MTDKLNKPQLIKLLLC